MDIYYNIYKYNGYIINNNGENIIVIMDINNYNGIYLL